MYRQGDILFIPVYPFQVANTAPQLRKNGDLVIAEGEVTGHAHRIKELQADIMVGGGGERFLRAREAVKVTHEEHVTVNLPKGDYRIVQQREYDGIGERYAVD